MRQRTWLRFLVLRDADLSKLVGVSGVDFLCKGVVSDHALIFRFGGLTNLARRTNELAQFWGNGQLAHQLNTPITCSIHSFLAFRDSFQKLFWARAPVF